MVSNPDTRYTLIGKLKDSADAQAWSEFAAIYQPVIFRLAIAKGLQHADAADLTQEVLTRVAGAIDTFRPTAGGCFRAWLYRITRNLVIDFLRKQQQRQPLEPLPSPEHLAAREASPKDSAAFHREFQKQIFWAAAEVVQTQVQMKTWQAFWKTEVQHEAVEQVASELQMTAGAIYVARSRVIARLRQWIESREVGG